MRAYVGVDWSANKVVCSTALDGGPVRGIRGCDRVLDEVANLLARVRERHPGAEEVHVLIEAGAVGWVRLFDAAGALVHVADPKQAKRFAESLCSSGAKDDRRDSAMLTEMLRSPGHCPPVWSASRDLEPLESLAAAHEQVTKEIVRSQQQLRSVLRHHMPLVEAQMKNLRTGWVRRFLHGVPTPWHAAQLDDSALDELLAGAWPHRRQDVREALTRTEAPWCPSPPPTHAGRAVHPGLRAQIPLRSPGGAWDGRDQRGRCLAQRDTRPRRERPSWPRVERWGASLCVPRRAAR